MRAVARLSAPLSIHACGAPLGGYLSSRPLPLEQAHFKEAACAAPRYHNVVQQRDAQAGCGKTDGARERDVLRTGCGIAAWMIVYQDKSVCTIPHHRHQNVPGQEPAAMNAPSADLPRGA